MNLQNYYDELYTKAIKEIRADTYTIDPYLCSEDDDRYGLSLIMRPSQYVAVEIQKFLNALRAVDSGQYYYPLHDFHMTLLSIISCYSGFKRDEVDHLEYVELINRTLRDAPKFTITFKGITASSSCIMIQGFMDYHQLERLRNNLRQHFKNSSLKQSLDERYLLQTLHATVVRFSHPIQEKKKMMALLEKYRDHEFGTFEVNAIELTYNDWYFTHHKVQTLHSFQLQ